MTNTEQDAVKRVLSGDVWRESAKAVVKWQLHLYGDFQQSLWRCISRADDANLAKLRLGFPIEVEGYLWWHAGDLARRLREEGLPL
jgi:hypothetical protein